MRVMPAPSGPWVERLRRGHQVYLVRDQKFATVEWTWEPPDPGGCVGRLGVIWKRGGRRPSLRTVRVDAGGLGADGDHAIFPVEGHLPEDPSPLPNEVVRLLHRELGQLRSHVLRLEREKRGTFRPEVFEGLFNHGERDC